MIRWIGAAVLLAILTGGCATAAKSKMDAVQARLSCGMSAAEVEAIVGERLQKLEASDPRFTHFYRSGMADLWLVFEADKLRSSQVVVVQGLLGTKAESIISYCK
jgi:hypothetical protein